MSAQEKSQQGSSVSTAQQSSTSSQQDDTLAPQNGQTESNQEFGGGRGQYSGNAQSGTDEQSGTTSQYGENGQSRGSMQQSSRSFDTMTGGS